MKLTDLPPSVRAQLQSERHTELTLRLPFPPTANNLFPSNGKCRFLSKAGKAYHAAVAAAAAGIGHVEGRLNVRLILFPPDRRRRDIANSEKAVIDGLVAAGVIGDDSQIDMLTIARREVVDGGAVQVIIRELP